MTHQTVAVHSGVHNNARQSPQQRTEESITKKRDCGRGRARLLPSFEAPKAVRFFDCGQNTLSVRRNAAGIGPKPLYTSWMAVICPLFLLLNALQDGNESEMPSIGSFRGCFPTLFSAQVGYFDQSFENMRHPRGENRAFSSPQFLAYISVDCYLR